MTEPYTPETLEKSARALYAFQGGPAYGTPWKALPDDAQERWRDDARAVLDATAEGLKADGRDDGRREALELLACEAHRLREPQEPGETDSEYAVRILRARILSEARGLLVDPDRDSAARLREGG
jgi:hypothetical protein